MDARACAYAWNINKTQSIVFYMINFRESTKLLSKLTLIFFTTNSLNATNYIYSIYVEKYLILLKKEKKEN